MTQPIDMGKSFPLSRLNFGKDATTARVSSANRVPVVDRSKVDPEIVKAAEGMEAMFLDYMMKVMRETVPKNDLDLESPATDVYRSMLDTEYAEKAVRQGGVGLADQLIAYMVPESYNEIVGQGALQKEKP